MADFRTDTSAIKVEPQKGMSLADMLNIQKSSYELSKLKELYPSMISEQQAKSKLAGIQADVAEQKAPIEVQSASTQLNTQQLENINKHANNTINSIQKLFTKPDLTTEDIVKEATELNKIQGGTPQSLAMVLQSLPKNATKTQLQFWLAQKQLSTVDALQQIEKRYPSPQMQNLGNVVVPVQMGNQMLTGQAPGQQVGMASKLGLGPSTEVTATENDPSGLPPGTKYYLGSDSRPIVSGNAPQTTTQLEVGNKLVNEAREAAKTASINQFQSNRIIKLAGETNVGTASEIWREVQGGTSIVPWTSDSASNYDKLGHVLAQQVQTTAQQPGINGTNAGQALSAEVSGNRKWTKEAIQDTARINRAAGEATLLYSQGINNAYKSKNPQKAIDYQNKWNQTLNMDTLRLLDAFKNKSEDSEGFKALVKEFGGPKSEKFISASKHLDKINELITKGE